MFPINQASLERTSIGFAAGCSLFNHARLRRTAKSTVRMSSAASGDELLFLALRHIRAGTQDLRAQTRPEHLNWIVASKRALFAGPMFDKAAVPIGSLVIARAKDMKDIEEWNAQDPYASVGMFERESFREWKMVYRPEAPLTDPIYVIICSDRDGAKDLRAEVRPKHLEWWKSSGRKGFIGPFPAADGSGAVGSMIITEGKSEEEVTDWSKSDPYNVAGVFESVEIYPMSTVLFDGQLV